MRENSPKILVIDDEVMIRETIADYLTDSGFTVLTAENGVAGLDLFAKELPAAVLVDLRMPKMDGLEVLARIRTEAPDTPVIVVSGTGVLADVIQALRLGAWDYLTKPIGDMAVLEHALNKVLERAGLIRDNKRYQSELEDQVRCRTSELVEANARLLTEVEERKAREEELNASLREKEVLLREIHHRVKNNLQVISSLLSLQARHSKNADLAGPFQESRDRVRSMAIIHEKLYQARNIARIDFDDYIHSLTRHLNNSYSQDEKDIELRIDVQNATLDIDQAIPCGLIINELVSNAFKHAFPDAGHGVIEVSFNCDDAGRCVLRIADDGPGFPATKDFRNTESLGLQLVVGLVSQIGGTIELKEGKGCRFEVVFTAAK